MRLKLSSSILENPGPGDFETKGHVEKGFSFRSKSDYVYEVFLPYTHVMGIVMMPILWRQ